MNQECDLKREHSIFVLIFSFILVDKKNIAIDSGIIHIICSRKRKKYNKTTTQQF